MYMYGITLFVKYEWELESLIETIRIYTQDIGTGFGIENVPCSMKSGSRKIREGIELLNQEKIRTPREKENYKFLGILEADTIKQAEMDKKNKKRVPQTNEKISKPRSAAENSWKK